MRVPVQIYHKELEEDLCYYDKLEKAVLCADYEAELDYDIDEVELDYSDLKEVVEEYTDDIIDILLSDRTLRNILLKKLEEKNSG